MGNIIFTRRGRSSFVLTPIEATGGTVNDVNIDGVNYRIHSFTSVGTSSFSVTNAGTNPSVDVLLIGGGGSGGAGTGGGGGAGGLIYIQDYEIVNSNYTVNIGAGGTNNDYLTGTSGNNSIISDGNRILTALGGGHGGSTESGGPNANGVNGGSGGGGQYYYSGNNGVGQGTQPSDTSDGVNTYSGTGFGNNGGAVSSSERHSSGGGGAGSAGEPNTSTDQGGRAMFVDITGTNLPYAEGGAGGNGSGTSNRDGIGGEHNGTNGTNGAANTGSGGGGG